jgi:hypothetical protein
MSHLNLFDAYKFPATLRGKNWMKSKQVWCDRFFCLFPLCPLCECLPLAGISQYPCPKFDIAALLYDIYNAYILKQRSIGATSEMYLFPAKEGAKYAAGPTKLPKMPNFQQMSMI